MCPSPFRHHFTALNHAGLQPSLPPFTLPPFTLQSAALRPSPPHPSLPPFTPALHSRPSLPPFTAALHPAALHASFHLSLHLTHPALPPFTAPPVTLHSTSLYPSLLHPYCALYLNICSYIVVISCSEDRCDIVTVSSPGEAHGRTRPNQGPVMYYRLTRRGYFHFSAS
jgi:hypothetical protein